MSLRVTQMLELIKMLESSASVKQVFKKNGVKKKPASYIRQILNLRKML